MTRIKMCFTIVVAALSMLYTTQSFAGFFVKNKPSSEVLAHHEKQVIKATVDNVHDRLTFHVPGRLGHVLEGTVSYLLSLAALCMVIIGIGSLFITSPVATPLALALLLCGGLCAGILAILLGYASDTGIGGVGRIFGGIAVLILYLPFLLAWLILTLPFTLFSRNHRYGGGRARSGFGRAVHTLFDHAFSPIGS